MVEGLPAHNPACSCILVDPCLGMRLYEEMAACTTGLRSRQSTYPLVTVLLP